MRTNKEMLDLFKGNVMNDDRIRLSVLEGSRTNPNIPRDNFQDYDLTFFVTDIEKYKKDDTWLNIFGKRVFMQKPEDMELFPAENENCFTYLMYFEDGIKIDLSLIPLQDIEQYFIESDGLVRVLIDKDERIAENIVPTDQNYWIKKPNKQEFNDCCNEFWSVATYVAKGLYRDELLFALDHFNQILRPELLRMISWEVGQRYGFDFSLGKNYKFIDQYISKKDYEKLIQTFSLAGNSTTWDAFELCCDMFRVYSQKVADLFNYPYPEYDEKITNFIYNAYKKLSEK
ncbi:aminoglycoside 6-adenylyltransferase [Bacillus wiedmannii]|uniref:aminoglycoside 6-adenylyltransferase n=1 Tax=Bacillus wiedmannii TaxID=1890302 RepID=UPI000BEB6A89|nr:aminoglycoside 6-adenylyltransferase [Bacillus wiedmannii]PEF42559.1 aminoglycoside adenylyltransferase [Bacillus wiedmannii]